MKQEQLERMRGQADRAMAALCSMPIQGPAVIPVGRAMEAVSALASELRELEAEPAGEAPGQKGEEEAET